MNLKKNAKFLIPCLVFLSVFLVLIMPVVSLAAASLVPCDKNCGWDDLMALVYNVVHFIFFDIAVPIAAIMFVYAGVLMVTSGGSTEQWGKAKKIFGKVAFGLIVAIAAWLIVSTVLHILGYDGSWIGF